MNLSYLDHLAGEVPFEEGEQTPSYLDLLADGMDKYADWMGGVNSSVHLANMIKDRAISAKDSRALRRSDAAAAAARVYKGGPTEWGDSASRGAAKKQLLLGTNDVPNDGSWKRKLRAAQKSSSNKREMDRDALRDTASRTSARLQDGIDKHKSKRDLQRGGALGLGALGALGAAGAGAKGVQMRRAAQARSLRNKKIAIGAGAGAAGLAGLAALASSRRSKKENDEGQRKTASYIEMLDDQSDY